MFVIRQETAGDVPARESLLDRCLGPQRFMKSSERLREGRLPARGLALTAESATGGLVGTVRLWNVAVGNGCDALLLGPLAIDPALQGKGLGARMMQTAILRASEAGHEAILLVGDAPYYARFGFDGRWTRDLAMPGPVERERFLGLELRAGSLDGARGIVMAAGAVRSLDLQGHPAEDHICPSAYTVAA
ncbi:MAG TPA: N-acetyltransferase [Saliniramus sp.]|nr:N-acetyltransferase [Saliniramus sp.]